MRCQYNAFKIFFALVAMLIVMTGTGNADGKKEKASASDNNIQIRSIPDMSTSGEEDFTVGLEKKYDFIGKVDEVQDEGLVIDDSYMKFAKDAEISGAGKGSYVGITLNAEGDIIACEKINKTRR
jgi:hypothetical protein